MAKKVIPVTYRLPCNTHSLNDDGLKIDYSAVTDKATPVNLTNHSYFNLSGDVSNTILNEKLMIDADNYTPVDTTLIPTGEIKSVKGTPFDFTSPKLIGRDIDSVKGGYDHNWVLNKKDTSLQKVAELSDSISGRIVGCVHHATRITILYRKFLRRNVYQPRW